MKKRLTDHRGRPRIVITGAGVVTPCGTGLEKAWKSLVGGGSGIGPITCFDASRHRTRIAGEVDDFDANRWFDDKTVRRNDRAILFAMAAADMAVAHSGLEISDSLAPRTGVIVGTGLGGLGTLEHNHRVLLDRGPSRVSPFFIPAVIPNLIAGQISIRCGARGANWTPVSACASAGHAIGEAAETLRRGACDVVVCGGSEATITPLGVAGFNALKALSTRNSEPKQACRPWDKGRDGFVMSEGAAILVLESLTHASGRGATILAELLGYGATADAHHITVPSGDGAVRCMQAALDDAGVAAHAVDYINAHGTSTVVGDVREVEAIKAVFGEHAYELAVSSTKSMHGHLLGAAGALEAVLTAEMLRQQLLLPTVNLHEPAEGCDLDFIPEQAREQAVRLACSNSLGFGGTNVTLVLRRWEPAD